MVETKDKFDIHFDEMLLKLKECQKQHNSQSCLNCDNLLDCELRDEYVKATYESMSKGKAGGFDF